MMRFIFVVLPLTLAVPSTQAEELPPLYGDLGQLCFPLAKIDGEVDAIALSNCMGRHQSAFDALRLMWAGLPDIVKSPCESLVAPHESHPMLLFCVQERLAAARRSGAW